MPESFMKVRRDLAAPGWQRRSLAKAPKVAKATGAVALAILVPLGFVAAIGELHAGSGMLLAAEAALACSLALMRAKLAGQIRRLRETEKQGVENEAKYRLLADNATDVIFVLDRQLARLYVSPSSLEMLGYGAEELIGTHPLQMIHPDDVERVQGVYREIFAGLEKAQTTERVRHRNGHYLWVEASFRLVRHPVTGEPAQLCGALRDISQRVAAEAARHEAEGNFRLLAENANDIVTRAGPDGRWRYVSPAATRLFGVEHTRLVGSRALDFAHRDDRAGIIARVQALGSGRVEQMRPTFRIVRPDGTLVWLEASSHVVFDPITDEPDGYVSVLRDITERIRAEAEIHEREERYRTLLQSVSFTQALYMLDPDGIVRSWNDGAERIEGYRADEIVGRHYRAVFTDADIAAQQPEHQLAVARDVGSFETRGWRKRKDGRLFFAHIRIRPVYREDGSLRGFSKLSTDITQEHIDQEQREIIVEAIPNGIMIVDVAGNITLVNAELERLFGFAKGELLGQPAKDIIPGFANASPISSDPAPHEFLGRARDGTEIALEVMLSPVETGTGKIVVASLFDVSKRQELTRRKEEAERNARETMAQTNADLERLSQSLGDALAHAERANTSKSRFLAAMSHELRTPLNGILGYAHLMQIEGGLDARQTARLAAMQQAGRHLLEMISCVLDLSEIEAGHVNVRPATLNVKDLAAAALDLVRPAAEEKGLWLDLVVADGVSPVLTTDPTRLRQILLNLLGNAVKFTVRGHIQLHLQAAPHPMALRIDVIDTGPGIPERHRDRLFQDFDRLDTQGSRQIEGAGLGLAVSSSFATLLAGTLSYLPNPAGGSVFRLDLPALDDQLPTEALFTGGTKAASGDKEPSRRLHVLVADDVEMNREIAASFLASVGHTTVCVEDGEAAAAAAAAADFDLVLMDVRMPGVDGLEAARRIRALPAPRGRVKILALTAQAFSDQIAACKEAGMDGHLGKPFSPDALIAAVEAAAPPDCRAPAVSADLGGCLFDRHGFDQAANLLQPGVAAKHLHELLGRCDALATNLATVAQNGHGSPALADQAHQLAGPAGILGFDRLATACRRFEYACATGSSEAATLKQSLPDIIAASRAEMSSLKQQMADAAL